MPAPIPYAHRLEIVERKEKGESLAQIAESLGYSYWGIRGIWRQYLKRGKAGLATRYKEGWQEPRTKREIYEEAMELKREHPGWGAGVIRAILQEHWPKEEVPKERTLQAWWRRGKIQRARQRKVKGNEERARKVHEVWQIDGVEVGKYSWITVTDEKSGAVLGGRIFPLSAGRADSAAGDAEVLPGSNGRMGAS